MDEWNDVQVIRKIAEDQAKCATPHEQLIGELLDSRIPKTEREHAAAREIEQLRYDAATSPKAKAELEALRSENARLRARISDLQKQISNK